MGLKAGKNDYMVTFVKKWFLIVCATCSAGVVFAGGGPEIPALTESEPQLPPVRTLRPVDTGRSMVFHIGSSGLYDHLAIKTNLLYGVVLAPNLGIEYGVAPKFTLELSGGYSSWAKGVAALESGDKNPDFKRLEHWLVKPELRYWPGGERFAGHFVGVQGFYADYQTAGIDIPTIFEKQYFYDGNGFGAGLVYGYHWNWGDRWGVEFSLGVGAIQMEYVRKDCSACDDKAVKFEKTYFGPTSAGVKLVFRIK